MSTAEERVALRKQRVLTGGKYEERQTWERFLRHKCFGAWVAMEIAEGGAASDDVKERLIVTLRESLRLSEEGRRGLEDSIKVYKEVYDLNIKVLAAAETRNAIAEEREKVHKQMVDEYSEMVDEVKELRELLTQKAEELVHAKRHIAEQDQEANQLERELLQLKKDGVKAAQSRRRKKQKVSFDKDVEEAAAEGAWEREQRTLQMEVDVARALCPPTPRGLVRTHPCA